MLEKIAVLIKEIESFSPKSKEEIDDFRLKFLKKKGVVNSLFNDFKQLGDTEKKEAGKAINDLKKLVEEQVAEHTKSFVVEK